MDAGWASKSLMSKTSSAVGQHRCILNMRVTIKTTERKLLPGINKFAPGRVPRHPAHIQRAPRGKLQSTLHSDRNGASGSYNRNPLAATAGRKKRREAGIYS